MTGEKVVGHRAVFFTDYEKKFACSGRWMFWANSEFVMIRVIFFPFKLSRYGDLARRVFLMKSSAAIAGMEFPVSTLKFGKVTLPIAGGACFRTYPYALSNNF